MSQGIDDKSFTDIVEPEPQLPRPKKRTILTVLGLIFLAGMGFFSIHAGAAKPDKASKYGGRNQITPVTLAQATQKTVPVQIQAIGNVQSGSTVSITPQASGRIIGVYFQKGQNVKKGQLLFTLDDRIQNATIQQAAGVVSKDEAQIEQARATLTKDQGAVEQARATLAKDQGAIEQAKSTLAKDQGAVRQAQANLAKDAAQAKYAQAQSDRYNQLYKEGAISQDQAQQYSTNSQASGATLQADKEAIANAQAVVQGDKVAIENAQQVVKGDIVAIANAQAVLKGDQAAIQNAQSVKSSDQGALDNVKVQSSYTKIYSPIDGRAGNILVDLGNVVQANSTNPLVTIVKIHPIQVSFSIPEDNLPQVQKYVSNGKLKVDVTFPDKNNSIPGILTFINNTVDNSTGTIQLIGTFDNADGRLFPGQFVNATLTLTQIANATVVPAQAVQNGPDGQFVFVVKPDMTVQNTPVTVSSTIDGLDVIEKGVQPGDKVVTDGQANLVTGSKIRARTAGNLGSGNDMGNSAQPQRHRRQSAGGDS
ncbi:efflux RND transporter periplasmic adaptor subunit [Nostoc sp. MS1]|uniref:efflux RND transporter periplasmic adaptor subunit n=1 Tax=Nostoc sp. MS1 TaxID=2764711 RepID=UPI001CC7F777|nr:efflux RND transporter periplasmic adaptor subunit [Nostoc sp. MS1]BCL37671.1 RND efflux membrane fusion protein [Nostoc sp. MS1]